eukprot:scaffold840_cov344-Pavlova_lutheri.AAC.11
MGPRVRKFVTGYLPTQDQRFDAGRETSKRISAIPRNIDLLNSELTSPCIDCTRRRRLRKKRMGLYADYKNVHDGFHWKLANVLSVRYDRILLPHLKNAKLSWGLKAKVSRTMLSQSHGLFLQRLTEKCTERGSPWNRLRSATRRKHAAAADVRRRREFRNGRMSLWIRDRQGFKRRAEHLHPHGNVY